MKNKIFILIGETASGKDYFLKYLLKKVRGLNKVVTYTSRPKREGEIDEADYHFVSKEEMLFMIKNNSFLEHTYFNVKTERGEDTWYYATHVNSFQNDEKNYICILDYQGYQRVKKMYRDRVWGFLLLRPYDVRKEAYLSRGGLLEEFERRSKDDQEKFKLAYSDKNLIKIKNSDENLPMLEKFITDIIKGKY